MILFSSIIFLFTHSQYSSIYDKQALTKAIQFTIFKLVEMEDVPEVISHLEGTIYMSYLRDAIVEYEKENSVFPLEKALDVCFLHLLSNLSVEYTSNLGVGIRFVVSKEYETQNLKAITKGVLEGLSLDTIKKTVVTE